MKERGSALFILVSLSLLLLLFGCQEPTITPTFTLFPTNTAFPPSITPTFTSVATGTSIPTSTASPTSTPTPTSTITPFPTLSQKGPHLAFQKNKTIVILETDGRGRVVLDLPRGAYVDNLRRAISPDGRWLVFHLGNAKSLSDHQIPEDLSINLIYIPDGSIHPITRLFPEDIDHLLSWGEYGNIQAYDWSSDGHYLAFTGAMDSQMTELYVYDMQTKIIKRMTNDSVNIWRMDWSPDTKWIWFESLVNVPCCALISF